MILAFFEDRKCIKDFRPLSNLYPVYVLKIGPLYLYEIWAHLLGINDVILYGRERNVLFAKWFINKNVGVLLKDVNEEILALNSGVLPSPNLRDALIKVIGKTGNIIFHRMGRVVAFKVGRGFSLTIPQMLSGVFEPETLFNFIESTSVIELPDIIENTPSNLIANIGELINLSLRLYLKDKGEELEDNGVYIEKGAKIDEPIKIVGPAYIGKDVTVESFSKIREASIEGPSVVDGTIKNSIVMRESVISGHLENTIAPHCTIFAPMSSSIGLGIRLLGFYVRVMPGGHLIGDIRVGSGSEIYTVVRENIEDLSLVDKQTILNLDRGYVIKSLRSYLYKEHGRLPSRYELSLFGPK